jgi:formate dehydrogenase major subunit
MDDRYRGVYGERKVIFINQADMSKQALNEGDLVTIKTVSTGGIERLVRGFKVISYHIPMGCIAAYYPETNPLVCHLFMLSLLKMLDVV